MQKATLCIKSSDITQGGKPCKNPKITWTGKDDTCLIINCEEDDCLTVQIPDGCQDQCISFIVECDDCDECPPHLITRCLCIDGECPDCEICVDGFCQPKPCPDGQVCDPTTEDCVDCIGNEDCPCNQVCVQGECVCADPSSLIDSKGCCVECLSSDDCEGCDLCIAGTCTPKDCGTDVLNPNTCKCQECLVNGDCVGANECCVQGVCRCCPGYIRNELGECVEIPDCTTDEDCPDCFVCEAGECVPQVCPDGRVCVDGECEIECTCPSGSCPPGQACTEVRPGICICQPTTAICSGPCDTDVDCDDPRCQCINNECVFVEEPPEEDGCEGPCNDGRDCDALDCGCLENTCTDCTEISCEDNDDCPNGCFCNDGTCAGNPCAEIFCETSEDCGEGCGCTQDGECVPCPSLDCTTTECSDVEGCACVGNSCEDDGPSECDDEFFFDKGECDLTLELATDNCCQCEEMSIRTSTTVVNISAKQDRYDFDPITIFKDGVDLTSLPDLENEPPFAGNVRYRIIDVFQETTENGGPAAKFSSTEITTTSSPSTLTTGTTALSVTVFRPGVVVNDNELPTLGFSFGMLVSRRIEIITPIKHEYTYGCEYRIGSWTPIFNFLSTSAIPNPPSLGSTALQNRFTNMERLVNCRTPLFSIYRNANGTPSFNSADFLYSEYATLIGASYVINIPANLEIDGDRVLKYAHYYGAETDCGCNKTTFYNCAEQFNPSSATPLVFCDPRPITEDVHYEVVNCGDTIEFIADVTATCEVYTHAGQPKPVYEVLINGTVADTRTLGTAPSAGNILYQTGQTISLNDGNPIQTLEFRIVEDECDDCTINTELEYTPLEVDLKGFALCGSSTVLELTGEVSGGTAPYTYEIELVGTGVVASGSVLTPSSFEEAVTNTDGTYTLTVTDADGCVEDVSIVHVSPADLEGVTYNVSCNGVQGVLTIVNESGDSINVDIVDTVPASIYSQTLAMNTTTQITIPINEDLDLTIASSTIAACDITDVLNIECCENSAIVNTSVGYSCAAGWVINNLPAGSTITANGDAITAGTAAASGNYNIVITGPEGCVRNINSFFVPQCYECVANACVAANPNINALTYQACQADCGCDGCDITLYGQGRLVSLIINGSIISAPTGSAAQCFGGLLEVQNFEAELLGILTNLDDCAAGISISFACIAPATAATKNTNNCTNVDEDGFVSVTIHNTTLDIEGAVWNTGSCVIPSETDCTP